MTDHQRTSQSLSPAESALAQLLHTIHGPDAAGVIELRLIEDKPAGTVVGRRWLVSRTALIAYIATSGLGSKVSS